MEWLFHWFMAYFRNKMGDIALIRNALQLFLPGLLSWPILINVMGILSPFWAMLVLKDGSRSAELLTLLQPYVP